MNSPSTPDNAPCLALDAALQDLLTGYSLPEVLERLAVVVRALPRDEDHTCPGGTVYSQGTYREALSASLEDWAT